MTDSSTFHGWKWDPAGRLRAMFGTTEVFDYDANDLAIAQPTTFASTVAVAGATSFAGVMTGARMNPIITAADTRTLTVAESGSAIFCTKNSATQVFTLPAASNGGLVYTFKCGGADGEILINPAGTDDIQTKAANDAGANIVNTDGTGIKNTAATNVLGDYVTLVSDGAVKWYTIAQSGIWASQ